MTKADIVNEITRATGIERAHVLETVEKFMEVVKESLINGEKRLSPRIRQLHHKSPLRKNSPQHHKKHHNRDTRAQNPGFQTRKIIHGRRKITFHKTSIQN